MQKSPLLLILDPPPLISSQKNLDRSLKFPGSCRRQRLVQEGLTYMQMKQRNLAASDPEREEEDQEYTHVPRALEKTPPTPSMLKLHN